MREITKITKVTYVKFNQAKKASGKNSDEFLAELLDRNPKAAARPAKPASDSK